MTRYLTNTINDESEGTFRFRIEARLKNADLVSARESLGLTAKEAAEKIGISYGLYIGAEAMQKYPSQENQDKICSFYQSHGIPILREDVFPEELRRAKPNRKYIAEREIPREMLIPLQEADRRHLLVFDPEQEINVDDLRVGLDSAMKYLTPREAEVITLFYGIEDNDELTYEQIGVRFNISPERIRQIKEKALSRLRHSRASKPLRDFLE